MTVAEIYEKFQEEQKTEKFKNFTELQKIAYKIGWLDCALLILKNER